MNNMNEEIIGGVSPLKRKAGRAKSRRGGAEAGKATAKKGNWLGGRGGYKKASGKQGTGVNRGGYNVHTRFKPREKPDAPKGGGTGGGDPTSNKPYSYDKDGNIVIHNNNYINTAGGTNTNTNINTNTNNVKNENDQINDEFGYRFETEDGETTESMEETNDTSYRSVWEGYSERGGKLTQRSKRYQTSGQGLRFDKDDPKAMEFFKDHTDRIKGNHIIHNNFEEYKSFMLKLKEWEKSGGKTITSKSNRKSYTKVVKTTGGKTFKIKYNKNTGEEISRTEVK